MKYAIITDGTVSNIIEASADIAASMGAIDATGGGLGDLWDGSVFTTPPIKQKDPSEIQSGIVQAVQLRLDTFAQSRNYDSILSASTYATSAVPKFAQEGQAAVNARDATWATLYTILGEVQSGTRPTPTGFNDIEAELPELNWS